MEQGSHKCYPNRLRDTWSEFIRECPECGRRFYWNSPILGGWIPQPMAQQPAPQRSRMKREEIEEKVRQLVCEHLGTEESEVRPESSFVDDLGADSLDAVEMVMAVEEAFDIEIPDELAEKMAIVDNVVDYVWGAEGKKDLERARKRRAEAFPHAKGHESALTPVTDFRIGKRTLSLYTVSGRTPSAPFSLYWNDENNPVQHAMTAWEVFWALHSILDSEE